MQKGRNIQDHTTQPHRRVEEACQLSKARKHPACPPNTPCPSPTHLHAHKVGCHAQDEALLAAVVNLQRRLAQRAQHTAGFGKSQTKHTNQEG